MSDPQENRPTASSDPTSPPQTPASHEPASQDDAANTPPAAAGGSGENQLTARVRSQLAAREGVAEPGQGIAPPAHEDDEFESDRPQRGPKAERVPVPSRREPLSDELERELAEALGDASLESLIASGASTGGNEPIDIDTRRRAPVVRIHKDNVFFALGGRFEGVASLRLFPEPPAVGEAMDVIVTGYNSEDDLYELSIPGASIEVGDWSDINVGSLVECRVTAANQGGLECMVNQIRGFIPASQVGIYRVENLADFVDQKLVCVVTEANPQRRNLVLSRRSVIEREREEARQKLLDEIAPGQTREGIVRSIREFGAFVDLGGIDGLIHISQLSWDRVNDPREVLEEGQRVQVRVEKIDKQTGKISLSYRSLQDHPWHTAPQRFPVGTVVHGVVSRIAKFGAFVKLAPGIEGLVHISELAHHRVSQVSNVLKEGQEVDAKVVSMDAENQRIGLSLKALQVSAAQQAAAEEPEPEEEAPQPARPKRNLPLKGGLDRGSGGDNFGLRW